MSFLGDIMDTDIDFSQIKGSTIVDSMIGDNFIIFKLSDNNVVLMGHYQDCCECVTIEEIAGDITQRVYGLILSIIVNVVKFSSC